MADRTVTPLRGPVARTAHTHLNRLDSNERVCGTYRVQCVRARRRIDGATFHEVTLADCTGSLIAYAWPETLQIGTPLPSDALVSVEFVTRQFANSLVADLRALDVMPVLDYANVLDLLPRCRCPTPLVLDRFMETVRGLRSEVLHEFVQLVFAQEEIALTFPAAPCSAIPARGGLLQAAVRRAERVSSMLFSQVESFELATVAALLSEIGEAALMRSPSQSREERTLTVCAPALEWLDHEYPDAALHFRHLWSSGTIDCGSRPIAEVIAAAALVRSMERAGM